MIGGQAIIINFGGAAFQVTRINGRDWAISIIIGLIAIPWGALIRLIPTEPLERWAIKARIYPDPDAELPVVHTTGEEKKWGGAIQKTIDNLQTYSTIRGGRLRASSIIRKSRTRQLREANISPTHLSQSFNSFWESFARTHTRRDLTMDFRFFFSQWPWFLRSCSVPSEEVGDPKDLSTIPPLTTRVRRRCTSTRTVRVKW